MVDNLHPTVLITKLVEERKKIVDDPDVDNQEEFDKNRKQILDLMDKHVKMLDPLFMLDTVTHLGNAPQLVYDDCGRWTCEENGWQDAIPWEEPLDVLITVSTKAEKWVDKPTTAILNYMEEMFSYNREK